MVTTILHFLARLWLPSIARAASQRRLCLCHSYFRLLLLKSIPRSLNIASQDINTFFVSFEFISRSCFLFMTRKFPLLYRTSTVSSFFL